MAGKAPDSLAVRAAVDRGEVPPVWLWSGPEDYLKDELFARLASKLVEESLLTLNLNKYRGGDDNIEEALATARTLPMLAARRIVLIRDVDAIDKGEHEKLVAFVKKPPPETALVLMGSKGPRHTRHASLAKAGAATAVFWVPFEEQTRRWVQLRFKDLGKRCPPEVARLLLETCGGGQGGQVPLREVAPEIEKVALSLGDRDEVGPEDLEVIGRKADEAMLYEICRRVSGRDLGGALRALDTALLFKANPEVRIVATLTHHMIQLAKVRDLVDSGLSPRDVQQAAGVWARAWPDVESAVRRFEGRDLRRGLRALAEADRTLKSTSRPARGVVERALVSICAPPERP